MGTSIPYSGKGVAFENLIIDIFKLYNFDVIEEKVTSNNGYDMLTSFSDKKYIIEVKYSKTIRMPSRLIYDVANRLFVLSELFDDEVIPVLIINNLSPVNLEKEQFQDLIIIDIQNLLYLVEENEYIKNQLLSLLDFSVNDLLPIKPQELFETSLFHTKNDIPYHERLKEQLVWWCPKENSSIAYEKLCTNTLNYLFSDELSLWHEQEKSNADLYRFDLVCKIKDGYVSGLWNTIQNFFNTKYIIFEFKNYSKPITQKEIYTTDKYLYLKALRGVSIIISCLGEDANAKKAIRGTLRENGKLILSISNDDLIGMIDAKANNGIPADCLYDLLDNILLDLEK